MMTMFFMMMNAQMQQQQQHQEQTQFQQQQQQVQLQMQAEMLSRLQGALEELPSTLARSMQVVRSAEGKNQQHSGEREAEPERSSPATNEAAQHGAGGSVISQPDPESAPASTMTPSSDLLLGGAEANNSAGTGRNSSQNNISQQLRGSNNPQPSTVRCSSRGGRKLWYLVGACCACGVLSLTFMIGAVGMWVWCVVHEDPHIIPQQAEPQAQQQQSRAHYQQYVNSTAGVRPWVQTIGRALTLPLTVISGSAEAAERKWNTYWTARTTDAFLHSFLDNEFSAIGYAAQQQAMAHPLQPGQWGSQNVPSLIAATATGTAAAANIFGSAGSGPAASRNMQAVGAQSGSPFGTAAGSPLMTWVPQEDAPAFSSQGWGSLAS